MENNTTLILASGSPRRSDILESLGLEFEIHPADIDESRLDGEEPEVYVERVAREKAACRQRAGSLVLAADTTVVIDGRVLGKPEDPDDARRMLSSLAGREHRVLTAVALLSGDHDGQTELVSAVESSQVQIASMSSAEISWYVSTGEPLDKAGAYAIQGLGSISVESIVGNYSNIVGLPVPALHRLAGALGYSLLDFRERE